MVAVVAAPGAVRALGLDEVAAAHAGARSGRTGPVRSGCSATTSASWSSCCAAGSTGRPRFSRESQPVLDQPHIVVVLDGGMVPPDSLFAAAEGLQGVTIVEVVPGELDEPRGGLSVVVRPGRLRLESGAGLAYEGVPDGISLPAAEALARQLAPLRMGGGDDDEPLLANLDFTDLLNLGDAASVDVARTWRPRSVGRAAAGADRRRRGRPAGHAGPQGGRAGGHGPARSVRRRDRFRQVGAAAHAGARPRGHALLGDAELRPRGLQGRCDLRRHVADAARRGGHHQPGGRPDAGRPHGRLDPR